MRLRPEYVLEPWQKMAVMAWMKSNHPERGAFHGILHVYTGAGKSVLAAAAMVEAVQLRPKSKFAIVVPTEALAFQWVMLIPKMTTISSSRVGQAGGGRRADFGTHDVVVYVLATARILENERSRLARDTDGHEVMLIVDECHKAGAASGQRIFDASTWARLGLSATPSREDPQNVDIFGQPLPVEKQPHGRGIGPVCFRRDLRDGIREGCLPRFVLYHHSVSLTEDEQRKYSEHHEKNILSKLKQLKDCGGDPQHYQGYISGRLRTRVEVRRAAQELQQAYFSRKQFLYEASERLRVACLVLEDAFAQENSVKSAIIFNERVGDNEDNDEDSHAFGAEQLAERLRNDADDGMYPFDSDAIAVEHSRLSREDRIASVEGLRSGRNRILVSVKALQEGLDVPDVSLGMSIASTASGRQRIQTMGRVLRPPRDPKTGRRLDPKAFPVKELHFIYVKNSPDEELYRKESWGEFFSEGNNRWVQWRVGADEGVEGTPLTPPPSEEEAWATIQDGPLPAHWDGPQKGISLSYRQSGISVVGSDTPVTNKTEVERFLRISGVPRGRVLVTPKLNVAITWRDANSHGKRQAIAWGRIRLKVLESESAPLEELGTIASSDGLNPIDIIVGHSKVDSQMDDLTVLPETDVSALWYELVQHACIAWVNDDGAMFKAVRRLLEQRRGRARFGRALLDALDKPPLEVSVSAAGTTLPLSDAFSFDVIQLGNETKAILGAAAAAMRRQEVVRKIADEFERIGRKKGKRSLMGLSNALRILIGESRAVLAKVEEDEDDE